MRELRNIIENEYGVGALRAPASVVSWAAHALAETHGKQVAEKQVSELNQRRHVKGFPLAYLTIQ